MQRGETTTIMPRERERKRKVPCEKFSPWKLRPLPCCLQSSFSNNPIRGVGRGGKKKRPLLTQLPVFNLVPFKSYQPEGRQTQFLVCTVQVRGELQVYRKMSINCFPTFNCPIIADWGTRLTCRLWNVGFHKASDCVQVDRTSTNRGHVVEGGEGRRDKHRACHWWIFNSRKSGQGFTAHFSTHTHTHTLTHTWSFLAWLTTDFWFEEEL